LMGILLFGRGNRMLPRGKAVLSQLSLGKNILVLPALPRILRLHVFAFQLKFRNPLFSVLYM